MSQYDDFSRNIIDSHIHVGWYDNLFFDAVNVSNLVSKLNISMGLFSSLSLWKEGMDYATNEILSFVEINPEKYLPLLWISPSAGWERYLEDKKIYQKLSGIKLHPFADGYKVSKDVLYDMLEYLRHLKLPIFAHTGNQGCFPLDFKELVKEFKEIVFILYHGRPAREAIQMALQFDNVFIETAYMEPETFKKVLSAVSASKIIFGSDLPLDAVWYPNESLIEKYRLRVESYLSLCAEKEAIKIFNKNISGIMNIKPLDQDSTRH